MDEIKEFLSIVKEVTIFGLKLFVIITILVSLICLYGLFINYLGNTLNTNMGLIASILGVTLTSIVFYIILFSGIVYFWK